MRTGRWKRDRDTRVAKTGKRECSRLVSRVRFQWPIRTYRIVPTRLERGLLPLHSSLRPSHPFSRTNGVRQVTDRALAGQHIARSLASVENSAAFLDRVSDLRRSDVLTRHARVQHEFETRSYSPNRTGNERERVERNIVLTQDAARAMSKSYREAVRRDAASRLLIFLRIPLHFENG